MDFHIKWMNRSFRILGGAAHLISRKMNVGAIAPAGEPPIAPAGEPPVALRAPSDSPASGGKRKPGILIVAEGKNS
jgi:hypothetical protein